MWAEKAVGYAIELLLCINHKLFHRLAFVLPELLSSEPTQQKWKMPAALEEEPDNPARVPHGQVEGPESTHNTDALQLLFWQDVSASQGIWSASASADDTVGLRIEMRCKMSYVFGVVEHCPMLLWRAQSDTRPVNSDDPGS